MTEPIALDMIAASLARVERKMEDVGKIETTVAVMNERGIAFTESFKDMKKSMEEMGKGYAQQAQDILALSQKVEGHGAQIKALDEFKSKHEAEEIPKAFQEGKEEGIKITAAYAFKEFIKPALMPVAVVVATWFFTQQQPSRVSITTNAPIVQPNQ